MGRKDVLLNASDQVCGNREEDYGDPEDNFSTIASFWSTYLDIDINAHDVAMMMVLFKTARIRNGRVKPDNYIDLAGYAACAAEINTQEN